MQNAYEREGCGNFLGVAPRLMQLGLSDQAVDWLQQIAQRAPQRADIWLEIGAVQWRLGNRATAARSLQAALRVDPNLTKVRRSLEVAQKGAAESDQRQNDLCELAERAGLGRPGPVLSGPFAGMRYVTIMSQRGTDYAWPAQRLGTYEQELHAAIEKLLAHDHDTFLNIGAGSGYYAVGMALRNLHCRVLAFETDPEKQAACRELAAANGVAGRVQVERRFSMRDFDRISIPERTMILCDCEGGELDLMRPAAVPLLARCDILCEVHDFIVMQTTLRLSLRFNPTHDVLTIPAVNRDARSYGPLLPQLNDNERQFLASDFRPDGMNWLLMTPRKA
jgi:hypothetical protein